LVLPTVVHSFILATPLLAVLGIGIFHNVPDGRILIDLLLGLLSMWMLAFSSVIEMHFPSPLALRATATLNAALLTVALVFHAAVPLFPGEGTSWRMAEASTILFWQVVTIYSVWVGVSAASSSVQGELWAALTGHIFSVQYYTGEDAKSSGEAALESIGGGLALQLLLWPLDLCSLTLTTGDARSAIMAACAASAMWTVASLALLAWARLRSPPAVVAPSSCLCGLCVNPHAHHVWLLDLQQHASEASQLALSLLLLALACVDGHPQGPARALMITSAVFRAAALPPMLLLDRSTRDERNNSYTNALGTAALIAMRQGPPTAEAPFANLEAGGEGYGSTGSAQDVPSQNDLSAAAGASRWRAAVSRFRVPWEAGHIELDFRRGELGDDSRRALLALPKADFLKIFRLHFTGEKGLDAGGVAREVFTLIGEALVEKGWFVRADAGDGSVIYQVCGPKLWYLKRRELSLW
jgi:hypothetical protein